MQKNFLQYFLMISIFFIFTIPTPSIAAFISSGLSLVPTNYRIKEMESSKGSYIVHLPINITSNNDFTNQALKEGWMGNGSKYNPYINGNYTITENGTKIAIQNTNVYFLIRNIIITEQTCTTFVNFTSILQISCYKYNSRPVSLLLSNVSHGIINSLSINDYAESGIRLENSSNITIENCSITGSNTIGPSFTQSGIYLSSNSENNTLIKNIILMGYAIGIDLSSSTSNLVINNTIINNCLFSDNSGSVLTTIFGLNVNLTNTNRISFNKLVNTGIIIQQDTPLTQIKTDFANNTVNGKKFVLLFNKTNLVYNGNIGQLIAINSTNVVIDRSNLSNIYTGVYLYHCSNFTIINSIINGNRAQGIDIYESINITIINNIFDKNFVGLILKDTNNSYIKNNTICASYDNFYTSGLWLSSSSNNSIIYNVITQNRGDGLSLFDSSNNNIIGYNSISHNIENNSYPTLGLDTENGIKLEVSKYNNIFNNSIYVNANNGIILDSSCCNDITWNNISYNGNYGIYLVGYPYYQEKLQNNTLSYNKKAGIFSFDSSYTSYLYKNNFLIGNGDQNNSNKSPLPLLLSTAIISLALFTFFGLIIR